MRDVLGCADARAASLHWGYAHDAIDPARGDVVVWKTNKKR